MRFTNPITNKYHMTWANLHKAVGKEIKGFEVERGDFDEICNWGDKIGAKKIVDIFRPALEDEYCEFDKKKRGTALNHDLYGYDPAQGVTVIQARQAFRFYKNGYLNVRKTYFLCGRNEITGQYFRHPVSSNTVRAAIRKNPDPVETVKAVQRWMWEVTEKQLARSIRQGDILIVPEISVPEIDSCGTTLTVAESHQIKATEIRLNGRCYALNPTLIHTKGQHSAVACDGWCSIRTAREVKAWDFAERVGD